MTRFETEEQQVEALKRWWGENGKAVTFGLIAGLAILVGSRFWYQNIEQQAVTASREFEQLRNELTDEKFDAVAKRAAYLRENFADTPYAVMAALVEARLAVERGQPAEATGSLRWVLEQEDALPEYKQTAHWRLARVLQAQGQSDAALAQLNSAKGVAGQARFAELRGDILRSQGNIESARSAYTQALALLAPEANQELLRMKLTDLGTQAH